MTIGLFGYAFIQFMSMERATIMNNWKETRCNPLMMMIAYWLKPDTDTRSNGAFAAENFNFCTKGLVQSIMKMVMAPFMSIFKQQAHSTNIFTNIMNSIKTVIKKMYDEFMSFFEPFFKKFSAVAYQVGIVTQKIKSAFQRLNAALLSAVYSGISIIKGINNAIQFVIFVVMIIIAIMVALIIIFFFILLPFIPILITPVLAAIIGIGVAAAGEAEDAQKAFCFTGDTLVLLADGSSAPIQSLVLGQALAKGSVEAILIMEGHATPLYSLQGVRVSGSHLVHGVNGWRSVDQDPRAIPISDRVERLYCLNTRHQVIPVQTTEGILLFRDWEEIDAMDILGQKGWNRLVSSLLGGLLSDEQGSTLCLMDPAIRIPTAVGLKPLDSIQIGDSIELSYNNHTRVIGIIEGHVSGIYTPEWLSSCIEKTYNTGGSVHRRNTTLKQGGAATDVRGKHLITDSGQLIVHIHGAVIRLRDFTEVGIDQIHKTYPFVAKRLSVFPGV
jgi:hypothetical protein